LQKKKTLIKRMEKNCDKKNQGEWNFKKNKNAHKQKKLQLKEWGSNLKD
jgi:hypothetical protein